VGTLSLHFHEHEEDKERGEEREKMCKPSARHGREPMLWRGRRHGGGAAGARKEARKSNEGRALAALRAVGSERRARTRGPHGVWTLLPVDGRR
jgi:hypothetical protein